jgi:glutathione S-transferase
MKLELISHPLCPFVHRSAIMLAEKGVKFDRRDVDLKDKPAWFLAVSPRGKVPMLLADGEVLFESSAINEFLDETHPPYLVPGEPFQRARERAWIEVANDLLAAQYALLTAPASGVGDATAKLAQVLARVEQALQDGTIDEGGFGLVHIALAPALHRFVIAEERLGARLLEGAPRVAALAHRVAVRPTVSSTVATDFAERFVAAIVERGTSFVASP